jgi:hypothetical protein
VAEEVGSTECFGEEVGHVVFGADAGDFQTSLASLMVASLSQ